jgi:subtilase family serine protease
MVRDIVDHHLADVITNSYGDPAGDLLDPESVRAATDNTLLMAAGTGISVLFSSGDSGDEFTNSGQAVTDYPASSPGTTAVGGSTLNVNASGLRFGELARSTARSFLCNSTYLAAGGCTDKQLGTWTPIDLVLDGG